MADEEEDKEAEQEKDEESPDSEKPASEKPAEKKAAEKKVEEKKVEEKKSDPPPTKADDGKPIPKSLEWGIAILMMVILVGFLIMMIYFMRNARSAVM